METLVLDGKSYVKASKAARDLGYATDYVGQLCRSGKVTAHLIGRTWYVNPDELSSHRVEKKRMSRVKAREQAHKSIEEHRTKTPKTPNTYKNIGIRYEQDQEELIPQTKKLKVQQTPVASSDTDQDLDMHPEVINKGEKVHMSGALSIEDVNDDATDSETTTLTPTLIRKLPKRPSVDDLIEVNTVAEVEPEKKVDFSVKLAAHNVSLESLSDTKTDIDTEVSGITPVTSTDEVVMTRKVTGSVVPYILIVFTILLITIFSIPLSLSLVYVNDGTPNIETRYNFSLDKTMSLLRLKI